jgi:Ni,Fe-hydrogenase III large subunit
MEAVDFEAPVDVDVEFWLELREMDCFAWASPGKREGFYRVEAVVGDTSYLEFLKEYFHV